MTTETWKQIPSFPEYEASDMGRIRSLKRAGPPKYIQVIPNNAGYPRVAVNRDGKQFRRSVHRLVWEAFNGPIPPGHEVDHKNDEKTDARLENLQLLAQLDNRQKSVGRPRKDAVKLSRETVAAVRERHWIQGVTVTALAKECNVGYQTMLNIVHDRTHRDVPSFKPKMAA